MEARRACAVLGRGKNPGQRAAEQRDLASQIPTPHTPSPRPTFPSHPAFSEGVRGKVGFHHRYKAEGKDAHYEPFSRYKGRAEKNWRGDESKTQHALPDDGKRAQTNKEVRSHVS